LALLAREASLVLPLLLLVLDRVPPERVRRPLRDFVPYAVVAAAYLALRAFSVAANPVPAATASVPLGFRMLTMAEVIVQYLGLVVVPLGLHMERTATPVASPSTRPRSPRSPCWGAWSRGPDVFAPRSHGP
jgi:hypothetical protein